MITEQGLQLNTYHIYKYHLPPHLHRPAASHLADQGVEIVVELGDLQLRQVDVGRVEGEPHRETEFRVH